MQSSTAVRPFISEFTSDIKSKCGHQDQYDMPVTYSEGHPLRSSWSQPATGVKALEASGVETVVPPTAKMCEDIFSDAQVLFDCRHLVDLPREVVSYVHRQLAEIASHLRETHRKLTTVKTNDATLATSVTANSHPVKLRTNDAPPQGVDEKRGPTMATVQLPQVAIDEGMDFARPFGSNSVSCEQGSRVQTAAQRFAPGYVALSKLGLEEFVRLEPSKRQVFMKACSAQMECRDKTCVKIHGKWDTQQDLWFQRTGDERKGCWACRDHLLDNGRCARDGCGFRHFEVVRPLTDLQRFALLYSYWNRTARVFPAKPPAHPSTQLTNHHANMLSPVPSIQQTHQAHQYATVGVQPVHGTRTTSNANGHAMVFSDRLPTNTPNAPNMRVRVLHSGDDARQRHQGTETYDRHHGHQGGDRHERYETYRGYGTAVHCQS